MSAEATIVDWSETRRLTAEMISYGSKILAAVERQNPQKDNTAIKLKFICSVVVSRFGFEVDDLLKRDRRAKIVWVRHIAFFLCRELTEASSHEIGDAFERDHVCVFNAVRAVKDRCECEADFQKDVAELRKLISESELFKS